MPPKPLRTIVLPCRACKGRWPSGKHCRECGGHGCHIIDRSAPGTTLIVVEKPVETIVYRDQPQRGKRDSNRTKRRRQADVRCTGCGSPQLATRTLCAACARKHRKVMSRRRTNRLVETEP